MIKKEEEFNHDNQQMSAIHLLAATCSILTRSVDQLTSGIQMAQEGKISPHLIDKNVLGSMHYTLTQRVRQGDYQLVNGNVLGLMKSPVTLVGHALPPDGYTLPTIQLLIHVPIRRAEPYKLLKYLDVPISTKYPDLFIMYDTKGYLALEDNHKTFAEINQQELDKCFPLEDTLLCPHIKIVNSGIKTCLMAVFLDEGHEKACATKAEHGTFNIKTLKPGLHLLTTLEDLTLNYHYVGHQPDVQEVDYAPGSYHLQLNDSIKFVSSPYFTIQGTMQQSVQLERHLTYKPLEIDVQDFNIRDDHTNPHHMLTPIDANISDFEAFATSARLSHISTLTDPISISRAVIVTLFILGVLASAFYIFRKCRPRRWKGKARTYRVCCCTTPSINSAEMKAAAHHVSAPAVVGDCYRRGVYPSLHNGLREAQQAQASRLSQPQLEALLPQGETSNPETDTHTIPDSPSYSCGQERR